MPSLHTSFERCISVDVTCFSPFRRLNKNKLAILSSYVLPPKISKHGGCKWSNQRSDFISSWRQMPTYLAKNATFWSGWARNLYCCMTWGILANKRHWIPGFHSNNINSRKVCGPWDSIHTWGVAKKCEGAKRQRRALAMALCSCRNVTQKIAQTHATLLTCRSKSQWFRFSFPSPKVFQQVVLFYNLNLLKS